MNSIKQLVRPLLVGVFIVLMLGCILVFPAYLVNKPLNAGDRNRLTPSERLKAENDIRTTLLQGLAGLLLTLGAVVTWRQLQISRKQVEINQDQLQQNMETSHAELHLSREGQITERFTRAIDHLGSDKLEIRLGGIYALERIARDSQQDHWSVMEILTAYLREHIPWQEGEESQSPISMPRRSDIEAILTVLRRRQNTYGMGEEQGLDLHGIDVRQANLSGAHLQAADLTEVHLEGARLTGAHLEEARLFKAHLENANLEGAHLQGAYLVSANLERANLRNANLQRASILEGNLRYADLTDATLDHADLRGADLRAYVIKKQVKLAAVNNETQLPEWAGEHVIVLPTE